MAQIGDRVPERVMRFIVFFTVTIVVTVCWAGVGAEPVNFLAWALPCVLALGLLALNSIQYRFLERALGDRHRNREWLLESFRAELEAADAFTAVACLKAEQPPLVARHIHERRAGAVRNFIFRAAKADMSVEEITSVLTRRYPVDPVVLREAVDEMTSRDGWPTPHPPWREFVLAYVRRPTKLAADMMTNFEASLRAAANVRS